MYSVGEREEDDSDFSSILFVVTDEGNREFRKLLFQHLEPRGFTLCEVSPFSAVEPLEDQEEQKEVWEIVDNANGLRLDDTLSVDPGDVSGGPCWEVSVCGRSPRNRPTYRPGRR